MHKKLSIIDRFKSKLYKNVFHLSIKSSADERIMSVTFKIALRKAYPIDYQMFYVMHFDVSAIQRCKKLTCYDFLLEHRIFLAINNFVEFHDQKMTRLDHFFV